MGTLIRRTEWHGIEAWKLSGDDLTVVMVPALGAKIVSLVDRKTGNEWLAGPGTRPVRPVEYGSTFTDQDLAGWDEMFPTIVACRYPGPGTNHGVQLPDHGEAWALPWEVTLAEGSALTLTLLGRVLPYRLTRSADFPEPSTLRLRYSLENLGLDPMPYLWAAHPQFTCGPDGQVVLPAEVTEVMNTLPDSWGWGPPEMRFSWPEGIVDGASVCLDRVGPPSLQRGRKFFALPDVRPAWAAVLRRSSGEWVRFEWDPEAVPYLGVWVDEGAFSHDSVAAPEPMTAWYDELELAHCKGEVKTLPAGGEQAWTLLIRVGKDGQPEAL